MKRILKLIGKEITFLWRTVAIIGLILIAFVSALLSVISVYLDVPDGIYAGLDEQSSAYALTVKNTSEDLILEGGTPRYGHIDGLSRYAVLTGPKGAINTTVHKKAPSGNGAEEEEKEEQNVSISVSCYAVPEAYAEEMFAPYRSQTANYDLPLKQGEIAINKNIANLIGAGPGDTVTLGPDHYYDDPAWGLAVKDVAPQSFTVVGYVNSTAIGQYNAAHAGQAYLPSVNVYFITAPGATYSTLTYIFQSSKTLHNTYLALTRAGTEATMQSIVKTYVDNIAIAKAFFAAIALVLGLMVIFILYALISIFYRQRRAQICRLKLLGARNLVIAGTYCSIAITLVFIAIVLGSLFSMAFNLYFIGLCGQLFKKFSANFVSHFRPVIPFGVFAVLVLVTLLLYLHFNLKVKSAAIAQEVRHE